MNTFDELYNKILSNYNGDNSTTNTFTSDDKSLSSYSLEDDADAEKIINDSDVEYIEDENSELYDIKVSPQDDEYDDLEDDDLEDEFDFNNVDNDSFNFDEIENDKLLTEADDEPSPFAAAMAEAEAPSDEETPTDTEEDNNENESPNADEDTEEKEDVEAEDKGDVEGEDKKEDVATDDEKDSASYQVKMDLIISNITAALKTTINTDGAQLFDKIIIYGFEESIKVFVEDYLKKMIDGDIKIDTIEPIYIIAFAAPNIDQIIQKIIKNLAKK